MAAPWWKKLLRIALLSITIFLFASCEPEPINDTPDTVNHISTNKVPEYILGDYTEEQRKEVVLSISSGDITLRDEFSYSFTKKQIFVNGDCWTIIYLTNGVELRISDYINELDMVVISLWENGVRVKEYGVYYKQLNK